LPGAGDVAAFWRLLTEGRCAIGRIPEDRWNAASFVSPIQGQPGATYTNAAGVVDRAFDFDPAFFGVSPREAAQMDPQQRLLLMTAWEALESAGAAPEVYADARTGVFVGASGLDYGNVHFGDPASGDSQFMTGNTLSIIANRVAHFLDARGPSFVVDTACSSSLFAFHAAWRAIMAGEIDRAVVGGVNMLLSPMPFIGFSRAGMLSPLAGSPN
jgi:acyl transferase domain-containing protein